MTCAERKPRVAGPPYACVARKHPDVVSAQRKSVWFGRMSGHVPWGKARWLGGVLGGVMASAVGGPAAVMMLCR